MKKNISAFAIIAVLCFLASGLSNAKPTDKEGSSLKGKGKITAEKVIE